MPVSGISNKIRLSTKLKASPAGDAFFVRFIKFRLNNSVMIERMIICKQQQGGFKE